MASFDPLTWLLLGLVAAAAVTSVLYAFACRVRDEVALHDLRVEAQNLRDEYMRRIAELRGEREWIEEELNAPPASAPRQATPPNAEPHQTATPPEPAGREPAAPAADPAPMKQAA